MLYEVITTETAALLKKALKERGAGAKTRVDYGYFGNPTPFPLQEPGV